MNKIGGRTRTSGQGRPKGVPNKATADVKLAAQKYTDEALKTLATIMKDVKQVAAARVAAANALLDRGHGKAMQPVQHELDLSNLTDEQLAVLALALGAPAVPGQGVVGDSPAPVRH